MILFYVLMFEKAHDRNSIFSHIGSYLNIIVEYIMRMYSSISICWISSTKILEIVSPVALTAKLALQVSDQWWFEPGHGDWCTCLEKYALCRDGMYHKVIDLTDQEESEYWMVVSAVFEGKQIASIPPNSSYYERPISVSLSSTLLEASINNKVHLLRTMLQWEEQVRTEAGLRDTNHGAKPYGRIDSIVLGEVVIVCWPHGDIMRMRTGSTAADAARRVGLDGKLVLVNGQLALPNTELKDGDIVEVRV
ncbi:hypothetical protein HHK36_000857 [Tetracentron sinense]|uniref:TGS domain-containing protein n=1 Tax=Tetracentron sinense TaxID=13715 RepID=A0A834ZWL7_TETSI|nr:hypothetical protein HHK36_000857 [Tetracentron sinense]